MKPWHSLEGKTIWVTGGAGYLGSAITAELDTQCAKVLCFDLPGKAEAFVRDRQLTRTLPLSLDINHAAGLPAAIEALIAEHGVPDGVVHLVTASSSGKRFEVLTPEEFQRTFDLALTPTFVLCRAIAERMKARGSGAFVLFSSMYGMVSPDPRIYHDPMAPNPIDYGASKAATLQMSRYLAVHYGPAGIRFNCVTPGPFPNPTVQKNHASFVGDLNQKTALRRIGQNAEIVGPTLFLLTDSASYVTGHSLVVDGGWTIW
ncbi:SDR family oxidoreductase [Horticoccus sp. 23ND18S-11]|uniref:SDR family oxidoreductase n=1 Tax=Horticoccus sp. 23ND18S-11 TaxID=3391832 RepID=UPI0039C8D094